MRRTRPRSIGDASSVNWPVMPHIGACYDSIVVSSLLGRVPARGENVQWREFGSETILLDPVTGQYAQVNPSGVSIWSRIDGQCTVSEIAQQLAEEFGTAPEDIVMDVLSFIEALLEARLITVAP